MSAAPITLCSSASASEHQGECDAWVSPLLSTQLCSVRPSRRAPTSAPCIYRTRRSPQPVFSTSCWTLFCVCHHHYSSLLLAWTEIPTRLSRALNNSNSSEPSSWGSAPWNGNSLVRKFISPAQQHTHLRLQLKQSAVSSHASCIISINA